LKRSKQTTAAGRGALELVEEAVHLMRAAPPAAVASYAAGTVPFLLGLLYFIGDMSHSANAPAHIAAAAGALALLFAWMKFWHALFTQQLRAKLRGEPPPPLLPKGALHVAVNQAIVQPSGLLLLPLALLAALPFGWVYAFYQNLSALDEPGLPARRLLGRAKAQAMLWPGGNHNALALLGLFSLLVFINVAGMVALLPGLLKMFTGVETAATLGGWRINTTFFAVSFALTWFCVDPLVKAYYVLRCFYGEALHSGVDLLGELRRFAPPMKAAALWLLFAAGAWLPLQLHSEDAAIPPAPPPAPAVPAGAPRAPLPAGPQAGIDPGELRQSIQDVLKRREYAWRMPREKMAAADKGWFENFMDSITHAVTSTFRAIKRMMRRFNQWLDDLFRRDSGPQEGAERDRGFGLSPHLLLYALAGAVLVALVVFLIRWRRNRPALEAAGTAAGALPDLRDDTVTADQLPESGWLAMARDLMASGDLRLALRALYLASLADLAQRELLTIARSKSNREYERELTRRAHPRAALRAAFGENLTLFEKVWYGEYETTRAGVDQFVGNLERMKDPAVPQPGGAHA
jgi:hypothetical protein